MTAIPITARIHLVGGQTITLACETFEVVPPSMDDEGNARSMEIQYTPAEGCGQTLEFLDFRAVSAIEVDRTKP